MKDDSITRFPKYQKRQKEMSLYFRAQKSAVMKSRSRIMADIRVDGGKTRGQYDVVVKIEPGRMRKQYEADIKNHDSEFSQEPLGKGKITAGVACRNIFQGIEPKV
jgi:hypothetical protein